MENLDGVKIKIRICRQTGLTVEYEKIFCRHDEGWTTLNRITISKVFGFYKYAEINHRKNYSGVDYSWRIYFGF